MIAAKIAAALYVALLLIFLGLGVRVVYRALSTVAEPDNVSISPSNTDD